MEKETEKHGETGKFFFLWRAGIWLVSYFLLTVDVGPVSKVDVHSIETEEGEIGLNLLYVSL